MTTAKILAQNFLEDFEKVLPWLPKNFSSKEVEDILGNFRLYPQSFPTTEISLEVYQAQLRVGLGKMNLKKASTYQLPEKIYSASRNFSEALLIFLDGAQPEGVFDVNFGNLKLATCLCFGGKLRAATFKKKIAEVEVDFGLQNSQKLQILTDQIVKIPLAYGFTATISFKVFGDFRIGGLKKFSSKVTGSELGLIFDGRGRPILKPGEAGDREKRSADWRAALDQFKGFQLSDF